MSPELEFAIDTARESAAIFKQFFTASTSEWKADNSPVTEADQRINQLIIERVKATFPDDGVLGEEASWEPGRKRVWAVDPIDGTQPYANHLPLATITLALIENGRVILGVVYEPVSDTLYRAERSGGAFKNDAPIHCSSATEIAQQYVALSSRMADGFATTGQIHDRLEGDGAKVFNFRSFVYGAMPVAGGNFVGAVLRKGAAYDTAAAAIIIEEAGGRATDLHGNELNYVAGSDGILVSNGVLHDTLLGYLPVVR